MPVSKIREGVNSSEDRIVGEMLCQWEKRRKMLFIYFLGDMFCGIVFEGLSNSGQRHVDTGLLQQLVLTPNQSNTAAVVSGPVLQRLTLDTPLLQQYSERKV